MKAHVTMQTQKRIQIPITELLKLVGFDPTTHEATGASVFHGGPCGENVLQLTVVECLDKDIRRG